MSERTSSNKLVPCLAWFTFCYAVAGIGFLGCTRGLWYWYITLILPTWDPPVWTVTPVSTVLYGLTAYSSWQIWQAPPSKRRTLALWLFFGILTLSGLWPWVLYSGHLLVWTVVDAVGLWVLLLTTTILTWKIKPAAGAVMIPSLVGVNYVVVLDIVVWKLNH